MDWAAIASVLGERSDRPITLLDRAGRIRMFNGAMERALGWTRFEVEGQQWSRICTPPERQDEARRWIGDAMRGALQSYEALGLTNTGARVVFAFECSLVGNGGSQGLLLSATRCTPAPTVEGPVGTRDLDYEVAIGAEFGVMKRICSEGEFVRLTDADARCFRMIHGLDRPCQACPILDADAPWPRFQVRHVPAEGAAAAFEVKSAELISATLVRIRARTITDRALEAIQAAKVEQLADRARLSPREREILMYMLLGRTIEDIATIVGIVPRTVKYHQANVLQKLGADSRADLFRILF